MFDVLILANLSKSKLVKSAFMYYL